MASTYELSNTTRSITESATLGMAKIARQLKSEGKDIISLSIGEPDFDTPKNIVTLLIKPHWKAIRTILLFWAYLSLEKLFAKNLKLRMT